ncbi:Spy/CpxP family protein refolding chaperone [bacterium]|nr:Spy/CpxP family protein refolding chaperone [bacterium]
MKGKKWWIGVPLVTAVLLGAGGPASARPPGRGLERADGAGRERLVDAIPDLTAEQKGKIEEIREEGQAAKRTLSKQLARARHDMEGEFLEDDPDGARLKTLVERMGELRTKLDVHRLSQRLAIRDVLTEEQLDLLPGPGERPRSGRGGPGHRTRHGGADGPPDSRRS